MPAFAVLSYTVRAGCFSYFFCRWNFNGWFSIQFFRTFIIFVNRNLNNRNIHEKDFIFNCNSADELCRHGAGDLSTNVWKPQGTRAVPGWEVWSIPALGPLLDDGGRRMGDEQQEYQLSGVPEVGKDLLSVRVWCRCLGEGNQGCRGKIYHYNNASPRWFLAFQNLCQHLQHGRCNTVQAGCHQGNGRCLPATQH